MFERSNLAKCDRLSRSIACMAGSTSSGRAEAARNRRSSVFPVDGNHPLFAAVPGAEHQTFGPVEPDIARVGDARIKRSIYPAGLRWSIDLRPLVGTERCNHAHVGFLASGALHFEYADGCGVEVTAPAVVDITPGTLGS